MVIRIFFLSCVICAACQQIIKTVPITKANPDTVTRKLYKKIEAFWNMQLWDSARHYLNEVADTVQKLKYDKLTYHWNMLKTQQAISDSSFDSATLYLNNALHFRHFAGVRSSDSIQLYLVWQHLLKKRQLYDSAIHPLNQAYTIAIRSDPSQIATVCYELAHIYLLLEDLPNAQKYLMNAWQNKGNEPYRINQIARLLVDYYQSVDNIDSAVYFINAYAHLPGAVSSQPVSRAGWYESAGVFLLKKGRKQEGLQNILKGKQIRDSIGNKNGYVYNNLADAYMLTGELDIAGRYIDSAIQVGEKEKDFYLLEFAWRTKSEIYLKQNLDRKAYATLDSSYTYYIMRMDSSFRNHAREVETKYAVREKDHQIKSLVQTNEANLKIKRQQRLLITGMIVGGLLLGAIAILVWKRRKLEMQRSETVLKQQLFRTQIEPHFLYNFVSVIQSFMWHNEPELTADYLNKFSRLMRLNFANSQNDLVSLQDEVDALENFLSLQQLLHDGKFDYRIEKPLPFKKVMIPPMILQPFVENAILKGFANISEGGMIEITLEVTDHFVHCIIKDNGQGFSKNVKIKHSSTLITQKRLNILSRQTGRKAKLSVIDRSHIDDGHGVRVELSIPYEEWSSSLHIR